MPSRLLLAATVIVLVQGLLGGCAAFGGADDAPTTAAGTGETARATAPSLNAASPTPEPGSRTSRTPAGEPARRDIRTTKTLYFGRPFETIQIPGTYEGIERATRLRLQVLDDGHWRTYPLPVLTSDSGSFSAYIELALGRYKVRLVDPATGRSTAAVTVLVF
jgi:hypothetical protein